MEKYGAIFWNLGAYHSYYYRVTQCMYGPPTWVNKLENVKQIESKKGK